MSGADHPRHGLDGRADAVFDAFLSGRDADLHPDDRKEAAAFWEWLGQQSPSLPMALPEPRRRFVPRWVAAAALVLAVGGGTAAWVRHAPAEHAEMAATYATRTAERRVLRLSDGSTVTLAANSRVEIAYTPQQRRLKLVQGEALFEVAHNRARPFIVRTPHGEVKAVGTAFDVAVARDEAKVTVVEGTIRIALPGGAPHNREPIMKLAARGERVAFGMTERGGSSVGFISQSTMASIEAATAWTRGQLAFQGEPLSEVIEMVNRYTPDPMHRLVLKDRRAAGLPVFGIVNQGDPAAIRDLIAEPGAVSTGAR